MLLGFELRLGWVYLQPFAKTVQPFAKRTEQETTAFEELERLAHSHSGELRLPLMPQLQLIAQLSDPLLPSLVRGYSTS